MHQLARIVELQHRHSAISHVPHWSTIAASNDAPRPLSPISDDAAAGVGPHRHIRRDEIHSLTFERPSWDSPACGCAGNRLRNVLRIEPAAKAARLCPWRASSAFPTLTADGSATRPQDRPFGAGGLRPPGLVWIVSIKTPGRHAEGRFDTWG